MPSSQHNSRSSTRMFLQSVPVISEPRANGHRATNVRYPAAEGGLNVSASISSRRSCGHDRWTLRHTNIECDGADTTRLHEVNTRDRSKGAATADQQEENATDRELTRSIRRALMNDKGLSSYAHNLKIITQAGPVTLEGPVRTEDEKHVVEVKATEVAGAGHVTNRMSVARQTSKR